MTKTTDATEEQDDVSDLDWTHSRIKEAIDNLEEGGSRIAMARVILRYALCEDWDAAVAEDAAFEDGATLRSRRL